MCGIWGYVVKKSEVLSEELYKAFMKVQSRGPDRSKFNLLKYMDMEMYLGFHRLAIMDNSTNGDQPFVLECEDRTIFCICNGEIYNFAELIAEYDLKPKSRSDCEVIYLLYQKFNYNIVAVLNKLRGEFAIALFDISKNNDKIVLHLARDQLGVRPLYIGMDENGFGFSSTLEGLCDIVDPSSIKQFENGEIVSYTYLSDGSFTNQKHVYFDLDVFKNPVTFNKSDMQSLLDTITVDIRNSFINAVECRMQSDRPMGALLSGGLDSSLVVSIAANYLRKHNKRLQTFSIGIPGSTDRQYAEMVAKHCDTDHTHIEFTIEQFLNAIIDVIRAIGSYDITTVRASIGQYLASKCIRNNTNIKVLLIGDGSDELTAGYLYFHKAPNPQELHLENIRLLKNIKYYDVLRADRGIASNGLEARVPFLDSPFVASYLCIDPELRTPMDPNKFYEKYGIIDKFRNSEKWLLRKSFDTMNDEQKPFLPQEVLYRKKEAFSDGVSSKEKSLYELIQEYVEFLVSEKNMEELSEVYLAPKTKEACYYRMLFNQIFHPDASTVLEDFWMPKWCGNVTDPSARVLEVYK